MYLFSAKIGEKLAIAPLRRVLAAALAVTFFAGLTSVANASCGDWLADSSHSMPNKHAADNAGQPANDLNTPSGKVPAPRPCNGPMCQKAPAAPAPIVPAATERVDKMGLDIENALLDLVAGQFSLTLDANVHPSKGFLPRIEHPPRA